MSEELRRSLQEAESARSILFDETEVLRAQAEDLEAERDVLEARVSELEGDNLDLIDRVEQAESDLEKARILLSRRSVKNRASGSQNSPPSTE